jgi:hypothetical protein
VAEYSLEHVVFKSNHLRRHCEQSEAFQTLVCGGGLVWIASLSLAMTMDVVSI